MKNVWVSIGEQWGVQNTKGKDGDARICEEVGPKKDHEGYSTKSKGILTWGSTLLSQNVPTPGEGYRRLRIMGDPAEKRMRGIIAKKHADIDGEE